MEDATGKNKKKNHMAMIKEAWGEYGRRSGKQKREALNRTPGAIMRLNTRNDKAATNTPHPFLDDHICC